MEPSSGTAIEHKFISGQIIADILYREALEASLTTIDAEADAHEEGVSDHFSGRKSELYKDSINSNAAPTYSSRFLGHTQSSGAEEPGRIHDNQSTSQILYIIVPLVVSPHIDRVLRAALLTFPSLNVSLAILPSAVLVFALILFENTVGFFSGLCDRLYSNYSKNVAHSFEAVTAVFNLFGIVRIFEKLQSNVNLVVGVCSTGFKRLDALETHKSLCSLINRRQSQEECSAVPSCIWNGESCRSNPVSYPLNTMMKFTDPETISYVLYATSVVATFCTLNVTCYHKSNSFVLLIATLIGFLLLVLLCIIMLNTEIMVTKEDVIKLFLSKLSTPHVYTGYSYYTNYITSSFVFPLFSTVFEAAMLGTRYHQFTGQMFSESTQSEEAGSVPLYQSKKRSPRARPTFNALLPMAFAFAYYLLYFLIYSELYFKFYGTLMQSFGSDMLNLTPSWYALPNLLTDLGIPVVVQYNGAYHMIIWILLIIEIVQYLFIMRIRVTALAAGIVNHFCTSDPENDGPSTAVPQNTGSKADPTATSNQGQVHQPQSENEITEAVMTHSFALARRHIYVPFRNAKLDDEMDRIFRYVVLTVLTLLGITALIDPLISFKASNLDTASIYLLYSAVQIARFYWIHNRKSPNQACIVYGTLAGAINSHPSSAVTVVPPQTRTRYVDSIYMIAYCRRGGEFVCLAIYVLGLGVLQTSIFDYLLPFKLRLGEDDWVIAIVSIITTIVIFTAVAITQSILPIFGLIKFCEEINLQPVTFQRDGSNSGCLVSQKAYHGIPRTPIVSTVAKFKNILKLSLTVGQVNDMTNLIASIFSQPPYFLRLIYDKVIKYGAIMAITNTIVARLYFMRAWPYHLNSIDQIAVGTLIIVQTDDKFCNLQIYIPLLLGASCCVWSAILWEPNKANMTTSEVILQPVASLSHPVSHQLRLFKLNILVSDIATHNRNVFHNN